MANETFSFYSTTVKVIDERGEIDVKLDGTDVEVGYYLDPSTFKKEIEEMNLESLVDEEWDKGTGGSWYAGLATILTMGMMAVIAAGVGWRIWKKRTSGQEKAEDVDSDIKKLKIITYILSSLSKDIENDLANIEENLESGSTDDESE